MLINFKIEFNKPKGPEADSIQVLLIGDEQIASSHAKKHLEVLVDERLDMEHLSRGVRKG